MTDQQPLDQRRNKPRLLWFRMPPWVGVRRERVQGELPRQQKTPRRHDSHSEEGHRERQGRPCASVPSPWGKTTEELVFQFGPWTLGRWRFASNSNLTNPLTDSNGTEDIPAISLPTVYRQLRADGRVYGRLSLDRSAVRYVPYQGTRYFIDMSFGSFEEYLSKFAAKTRNTLRRKLRRFAEESGGRIDARHYESPEEMSEFCRLAIDLSRLSYQSKIGFGFPETEDFTANVIDEARNGRVCGFVLFQRERPVSYVFCRINSDIVSYWIPGYDPQFRQFSPGTVLLYAMLDKLFKQRRFRVFDFGGHAWPYKALFATGGVDYIKVMWFPITGKNLLLVTAHYALQLGWRGASRAKTIFRKCSTG
jgi:Acetyltransferase (GNAT) domain